jgi:chitinase
MDFVNVMAYDECDDSGAPCNHAPLEVATRELDYFVKKRKLPAAKVVLGLPFYGYCWGADCGKPALTYAAIVARFPDAPGKDWIELPALKLSYNGRATIARKVALGRANGGVMVWQVAGDAPPPESLLDVIATGLTSP